MSKIKVIIIEPNKELEVKEIENTLESKQSIVGGYIEVQQLDFDNHTYSSVMKRGNLKDMNQILIGIVIM